MTPQQYLEGILAKYNLEEYEIRYMKQERSNIEYLLRRYYGSKISTIYYSGSYAKGTSVKLKYDLDICIYFNKNAFPTLKEMFENVLKFLNYNIYYLGEDFGRFYNVVKQNVSIGLISQNKYSHDLDIVPARRIDDDSTDVNLYESETGEHIKTNIPLHIKYISEHKCRPIIKLMKVWKYLHGIHLKSFALELITIKALENINEGDYGAQVKHVFQFIIENIGSIKLIDPANSNNIVSNYIGQNDKINIKNQAKSSLNKQYWEEIVW